MGRLFGTDGARGVAITELTCELAMQIGRAAAIVLTGQTEHKPRIFIGKDTRVSSDILEAALIAGICSVGADAHILGVVPTPAVAYLVKHFGGDAGVMISASHNSVEFNGIKLFSGNGYKLSDEIENEIERLILDNPEEISQKDGTNLGHISYDKTSAWDYIRYVMKTVPGDLSGLRIAVDCANGSACATAERIFSGLSANCIFINAEPNGNNINEKCGSTHLDSLILTVKENKCHIGVAFDGDADRCLAVDENGNLIDGDKIIAILANDMKKRGSLRSDTAVVTVMSNIGFSIFADRENIKVITTKVGDRYVLEQMLEGGYNIGGEPSGHVILLDYATTGDGQLSAVKLLSILSESGKKASEVASIIEQYPQVLVNTTITAEQKSVWQNDESITKIIEDSSKILGSEGRILVRESGTEPLVRVMVEGKRLHEITKIANNIADKIKNATK